MDDLTVGTVDADIASSDPAPATDMPVDNALGDTATDAESSRTSTFRLADGSEVGLDELERGYLRQSDYTRKTQELSKQREELAQAEQLLRALESDPQGTLEALQRHLVGDVAEQVDLDPLEAEVKEHREFIEQQRALAIQREVEAELAGLTEQYGEFDWPSVLEFAVTREIPDLEAAYLLWTKQMERESARQAANEKALTAKRSAPPVAGGSRAQGTVDESVEINSVMDAWRAAKRELGFDE